MYILTYTGHSRLGLLLPASSQVNVRRQPRFLTEEPRHSVYTTPFLLYFKFYTLVCLVEAVGAVSLVYGDSCNPYVRVTGRMLHIGPLPVDAVLGQPDCHQ